jgi:hypothetical protein
MDNYRHLFPAQRDKLSQPAPIHWDLQRLLHTE